MTNHSRFSPIHGGNLISASKRFDVPLSEWIDLSTGINPETYPIPELPSAAYRQLPYVLPDFLQASANYYGSKDFVAVAGTQAAIQILPEVLPKLPILIPEVGYQEHAKHWDKAGTDITRYPSLDQPQMANFIDAQLQQNNRQHLLVINPNNPTGVLFGQNQLLAWAETLSDDAYLIVDEAFIDLTPEKSLLGWCGLQLPGNIIVLRSFGKFFGLAGIRLGYIFAHPVLLTQFEDVLGLWQVNGPAQHIAIAALNDVNWHQDTQLQIRLNAEMTNGLLRPLFEHFNARLLTQSLLFTSYLVEMEQAEEICNYFASSGILLRVIEVSESLAIVRVGALSGENETASLRIESLVEDYCSLLRS